MYFNKIKKEMLISIKSAIRRLKYTNEEYIEEFNKISFTNCKTLEEVAEEMTKEYLFFKESYERKIFEKGDKKDELPFG